MMSVSRTFFLAAALCAVAVAVTNAQDIDCTLKFNDGTHFDLAELQKRKSFNVKGGEIQYTAAVEQEYNFQVAVCRDIQVADWNKVCSSETEEVAKGPGPVFQIGPIEAADQSCHRLGQLPGSQLSIIDPADPTFGVKIDYQNGGTCSHTHKNVPCGGSTGITCPKRHTAIYFICKDIEGGPSEVLEVDANGSPSHCEYQIKFETMHACPQECGRAFSPALDRLAICGGHGICGYDQSNSKAKCFCDDGWSGSDCGTEGDAAATSGGSSGATTGLLVVLIIITLGLVAVVIFMAKQVRAYRNDATNYMQIRGQEMVDQMSTI